MLKKMAIFLLLLSSICFSQNSIIKFPVPERAKGQTDVLELRTKPLDIVRVAYIGLGMRGYSAVYRASFLPNVKVVALCDVVPEYVEKAKMLVANKNVTTYTAPDSWKEICKRDDVDLVYISTHWDLHAPIAVMAMENGRHVAVEVPVALTLEECWQLVDTAERTKKHCIMLENCNYDFFELATLNMAQQGLFGEIVHVEGAYIHDLRNMLFADFSKKHYAYWNNWRLKHNINKNGNLYPTHGFGPIAHILNIHRGDKLNFIVSVSSNQFGLTEYAKKRYGEDSLEAKEKYLRGDMNTSIIKTQKGKTIMIQHDITSPRPYDRIHKISGTKGYAVKYPKEGLAFEPNGHNFLSPVATKSILKKYEHPIVKEIGKKAKMVGGHGGMDFIMDYRLFYCLQNGLPLDMDVYDAVEWSAVVALSIESVKNSGAPVEFPDFTRGAWSKLKEVKYYN